MYLIEATLYTALFVFLVVAFIIYKLAGSRSTKTVNTARITSAPRLTPEQMRCHGVWVGQLPDATFYFCISEIGQFIEGIYFQDVKQIQFAGTYLAPQLTFDVLDENGSTSTFSGRVDDDGKSVSGQCSQTNESPWSAKLLSIPAQTKSLHLDVLSRLTLTYIPPDEPELRAKILSEFNYLTQESSLADAGDASVRVWKVADELQGKSKDAHQSSLAIPTPQPVDAIVLPTPVPVVAPSPLNVSTTLPSAVVLTSAVAPTPSKQDYVTAPFQSAAPSPSAVSDANPNPSSAAQLDDVLCPKCQSPFDRGFSFCLRCGHVPAQGIQ